MVDIWVLGWKVGDDTNIAVAKSDPDRSPYRTEDGSICTLHRIEAAQFSFGRIVFDNCLPKRLELCKCISIFQEDGPRT